MSKELAFVMINPYSLAKSRTGGVIARIIGRTQLDFVAARMFGPGKQLTQEFAAIVRASYADDDPKAGALLSDYIMRAYAPDPADGRPRRVMLLLFEGDHAVDRVAEITGKVTPNTGTGQTIRDTFGDYVLNDEQEVQYFEPAVLAAHTKKEASDILELWSKYSESDGGLIGTACDIPQGENVERTLVMLKPDNFRFRSLRPGNIIDLLSRSGLRIVAAKKFSMTVAQAEEFYGPVKSVLEEKFSDIGGQRAADVLNETFDFKLPASAMAEIDKVLAPHFSESQFENIVNFMTGYRPSDCPVTEKDKLGREECFALIYEGHDAVKTIRGILGTTDPSKAEEGSVRKEFGSDVMVNAAHASDSPDNAKREFGIIRIEEDSISPWVERYYGQIVSRMKARLKHRPGATPDNGFAAVSEN